MKSIERRLPQDIDKSFIVFNEVGTFFPYPWHYHPEYELVYVRKSTGRRMVGDDIGFFDEGDLVFMGPLLPHVWVNDPVFVRGEAGYLADAIVVQFIDTFLGERFMQIPEVEAFKNFLWLSNRGMVIKGKARKKITTLMDDMLAMNGLQRLSSLLMIFDILAHTNEYELLASPVFIQDTHFKSSDHFRKINEYIMRNFHKDISLGEIASVANMAITTFCNFFKSHYRVTFVEYLNTVKIGHACKLLSQNELNIVEVAYESGFNNLANFNKQFKNVKQMTPSEYKKTLLTHPV
jgi:AraC-like DNA-binding protein